MCRLVQERGSTEDAMVIRVFKASDNNGRTILLRKENNKAGNNG